MDLGFCRALSALEKAAAMLNTRASIPGTVSKGFPSIDNIFTKISLHYIDNIVTRYLIHNNQGCQLPRLDISACKGMNKDTSLSLIAKHQFHIYVNLLKSCNVIFAEIE